MSTDPTMPGDEPSIDIVAGREAPPHTPIQDWVSLSGVSSQAIDLYGKLKMHVNRQRGDSVVWPGTLPLAMMLGYKRGDKITPFLKELDKLGAIDIQVGTSMPRRNVYVVHSMPPKNYAGPLTLKEWYQRHRAEIDEIQAAEKEKRDERRAKKKNAQVAPVAPEQGQQVEEAAVAPESGERVTSESSRRVTPGSGREPKRTEPGRNEQPPPTTGTVTEEINSSSVGGGSTNEDQNKTAPEELTLATVVGWFAHWLRPGGKYADLARQWPKTWNAAVVEEALRAVLRNPGGKYPVVDLRQAAGLLRQLADGEFGPTESPRRLAVPDGAWWALVAPQKAAETPKGVRCPKPEHAALPPSVDGCKACRAEKLGGGVDEPEAPAGLDAEVAARRANRWMPSHLKQRRSADEQVGVSA